MTVVTITLPLPPPELRSNARGHWAAKSRAVKKYREQALVLTLQALDCKKPRWHDAIAVPFYYFDDRRHRDMINLNMGLKAAIDGMVDAGLLEDDEWLTLMPPIVGYDKENPRVVVAVREGKYVAAGLTEPE